MIKRVWLFELGREVRLSEPKKHFAAHADAYVRYISVFLYPQGCRAFFADVPWIGSRLRVLDAGCGTGIITFALLEALGRRGVEIECVHGFDLTPAMLGRFRSGLRRRRIKGVNLHEADMLKPDQLPATWTGYDLIVSASMLEYVPRDKFSEALASLRGRLSPGGRFLLFITRRNWLTSVLVERPWGGARYSDQELATSFAAAGFAGLTFHRFPPRYGWLNLWGYIVEAHSPTGVSA